MFLCVENFCKCRSKIYFEQEYVAKLEFSMVNLQIFWANFTKLFSF